MQRRHFLRLIAGSTLVSALQTVRAEPSASLTFAELYKSITVTGMAFSDKTRSLVGKPVSIKGYMAPPLRAESNFFVLTRIPVSICPFCDSDADWPSDIVVIYLNAAQTFAHSGHPIEVTGQLEFGSKTDPDTGFVSQLRLMRANYRPVTA